MKEINLREYYPFYNMDVYLEVSDEIAGQLDRFKLDEEAHRVRVLRAKAYFSLAETTAAVGADFEGRAGSTPRRCFASLERLPASSDSGVLSGRRKQGENCQA